MTKPQQAPASVQRPFQIRKARIDDAINIAKLGAHVFAVTFGHSVPSHELQAYLDKEYSTASITRDLEDPTKDTIVATGPNDEVSGFAVLTRGTSEPCVDNIEDKVELQRIYVHPVAHGKGLGGLLAKTLEQMAREQSFRMMWLGVWEENHSAQKVYEKWGYKRVGEHNFVIGSVAQTDYIMTKNL